MLKQDPIITYDVWFGRNIGEAGEEKVKDLYAKRNVLGNPAVINSILTAKEDGFECLIDKVILEVLDADFEYADYKVTVYGQKGDGNLIHLDEFPVLHKELESFRRESSASNPREFPYKEAWLQLWFENDEHAKPFIEMFKLKMEDRDFVANIPIQERSIMRYLVQNGFEESTFHKAMIADHLTDMFEGQFNLQKEGACLRMLKTAVENYSDAAKCVSEQLCKITYMSEDDNAPKGLLEDLQTYVSKMNVIQRGANNLLAGIDKLIEDYNKTVESYNETGKDINGLNPEAYN